MERKNYREKAVTQAEHQYGAKNRTAELCLCTAKNNRSSEQPGDRH